MVNEINQVRKAHGVRSLHYSPSLARSSSRFVHYLARTERFAHTPRILASRHFSRLGEILAITPERTVQRASPLDKWLRSPTHRAVLLSRSFRYIGAARTLGYSGLDDAMIWAVQFGR